MSNQGLFGALDQYWSVEPKVRLHRRNTYFNQEVSDRDAFVFGFVISVLAIALICFWSLIGVIL